MLGGEIPDLDATPCAACGQRVAADEAVWDPWHQGPARWAALPYHRACAGEVLPPDEPPGELTCGLCRADLPRRSVVAAWAALRRRFEAPAAPGGAPELVWRLVAREPRRWVPEHLTCVLARVTVARADDHEGSAGSLPGGTPEPPRG